MGELIRPQAGPPNSFIAYFNEVTGSRLNKISDVQVPVYEQERFERNIIFLRATANVVGPIIFTFDGNDLPSFIVREINVIGEAIATRPWSVVQSKNLSAGTLFTFERASVSLAGGNKSCALIGPNGNTWRNNGTDVIEFHTGAPFICYRGMTGFTGEFFDVRAGNTAGQAISVHVVLELIPNPSQYRDMSDAVLIT